MPRTVVIKGRVLGPHTVELETPLPGRTLEVEVVARISDRVGGSLSDYVRFASRHAEQGRHRPAGSRGTGFLVLTRVYLDTNPIIYSIEGVPEFRTAALAWIEQAEAAGGAVITSRLSRLECRVKPLRDVS